MVVGSRGSQLWATAAVSGILMPAMPEEETEKIACAGDHEHGLSRSCLCALRPCCQGHLHSSYPSSSGRSRVSEGNFSAVGLHAGLLRVERCLNHDGEKQMVTSTACPLDVFCLTTLSNHFLLSLGFLYFLSLNHKRVFEVCSAPTSALSVLSGRGHGVQY